MWIVRRFVLTELTSFRLSLGLEVGVAIVVTLQGVDAVQRLPLYGLVFLPLLELSLLLDLQYLALDDAQMAIDDSLNVCNSLF